MENQQSPPSEPQRPRPPMRPRMNTPMFVILIAAAVGLVVLAFSGPDSSPDRIPYSLFRTELAAGNITKAEIRGGTLYGEFKEPPAKPDAKKDSDEKYGKEFFVQLPPIVGEELDDELVKQVPDYSAVHESDNTTFVLLFIYIGMAILVFVVMMYMVRRMREQFMGGGFLGSFSKSPARRYQSGKQPVTFKDVAGLDGVKNDLQEIVTFLKDPERFQRLGARVPKGVLLMGPPGTGKTLLARAVAGEAGVPFYSINGSEFIQLFVGVGASRVRDLFKNARDNSPCILFIDEIDAVGRQRGAGYGGGHDEREQTLNQILSEMDGFSQTDAVIVLAATNRPDVLDPALLRPGRFDRHVTVDAPTRKARQELFKVHTQHIPLADDVDFETLAGGTIGLTGADIRNLCNEAALIATRDNENAVDMEDFETAKDKILMGATREELLSDEEKKMTAYHEAGHAMVAWLTAESEIVSKVTIVPRGRALGVTQIMPDEERLNVGERRLRARLSFMLGGRAAEKLIFDEYSAGAENDLQRATAIARKMVAHWGMSERLGPVAYRTSEENPFLGREQAMPREFSEHTARLIDEEVARILHQADEQAKELLDKHRDKLDAVSQALLDKEILDNAELHEILGPPVGRTAVQPESTVEA